MTDELKRRMARLREIAPRLNAATDSASRLVTEVEKFLVDELRIGVTARVCYEDAPAGTDDDGRPLRTQSALAFGRVGGAFRIHVQSDTVVDTGGGAPEATLSQERLAWPSCSRETKLKAFEKLPELLEKIIEHAERLAHAADDTSSKLNAMIGEEEAVETPPRRTQSRTHGGAWDQQLDDAVQRYQQCERDMIECETDGDAWEARMEAEGREDADPHDDHEQARAKLIRLVCLATGHDPGEPLAAPIGALTAEWLLVVSPGRDDPWDDEDEESRRLVVVPRASGLTLFS
jgi:hypothetical protein